MASKSSLAAARSKDKLPAITRPGPGTSGENRTKPTTERRSPRPVITEKKPAGSRGRELRQTQENHGKTKESLSQVEKAKSHLPQDLARSRRTVEDVAAKLHASGEICRKGKLHAEETENTSLTAAEDWQAQLEVMKQQYEAAVVDLQTNKQAMENLRHELEVCVEAKDEAVRLAAEAMNAAESTSVKVEELAAELSATKGSLVTVDSAASRVDELTNELSAARQGLAEANSSLEVLANEKANILAVRESDLKELADAASSAKNEIDALKSDLALAKESELQIANLSSTLEHLRSELASAKAAKHRALMSTSEPNVDFERTKLEVEAAKTAELMAVASLATVSAELEVAQENLIHATVERATLGASLEFLKCELERSQSDVIDLKEREEMANVKTEALNVQLAKLSERDQTQSVVLKERQSDARALSESLEIQFKEQKLELAKLIERESAANANAGALTKELESHQRKMVDQQTIETSSVAEVIALTNQLESSRAELLLLKEREAVLTSKLASLTVELSNKESEAAELKERLFHVEAKVTALNDELNILHETQQINLLEQRDREAGATAESAAMDPEMNKLQKDLEDALTLGKLAREEADNLHLALQTANSEKEQAKQEAQILIAQIERSRHEAMVAQAELKAAKDKAQTSHAATLDVHAEGKDKVSVEEDGKSASEENLSVQIEAENINEQKRSATTGNMRMASKEIKDAQVDETQSARKEADFLHTEIPVKEEAIAAEQEAQILKAELDRLKTELDRTRAATREAQAATRTAENGLQDGLKKTDTVEVNGSFVQGENNEYPVIMGTPWVAASQDELDLLKLKLVNAEGSLGIARTEISAFNCQREQFLSELNAAKEEIELHKRAAVDAHQQLAETERARLIMELEIQKLLDDSKHWHASQEAIDIQVQSEMNDSVVSSESRENKPQPDLSDRVFNKNLSFLHKQEEHEEQVTENELSQNEDATQEDVVSPTEVISLQTKKKKKALLSRLGTYLEKKKNQQTP